MTIDDLINKVNEEKTIGNGTMEKIDSTTAKVTTEEGYIFNVTATDVKKLEAGLYNLDDELIVPWDTLVNTYGMDIEKDYTYGTYNTDVQSPYKVFTDNNLSGKLVVNDNVTKIGDITFYYCTGLVSIVIPDSVTSIGENAFANIPNIYYNGTATGSPWGALAVNGVTQ